MANWSSLGSINSNYKLELIVWESYVGTSSENYSTVNWEIILHSTGNYSFSLIGSSVAVNVDGEVYNEYSQKSISAGNSITIASGSKKITHSDDGSKSISCSASFTQSSTSNYTPGNMSCGGTLELTKIPRYATVFQSLNIKTINTIKMNWSANATIDYIWYSTDNGSTWTGLDVTGGMSGTYTISNLSANTSYNIKTRVRRKDSQLTTDSGALAIITYDYAKITDAPNVTIGNDATIKFTNPSGATIQIGIFKNYTSEIVSYRTVTGNSYTFKFTDDEINKIYELIPNNTSVQLIFFLKTTQNGIDYWDNKTKTFSVNLSTNKPVFSNYTYQDTDTQAINLTGNNQIGINKVSDFKVTIPKANKAVGKNYATINKYRIIVGNTTKEIAYSSTEDLSVTFTNINSNTITVSAIDSRGLETSVQKSIAWKPYTYPTFLKFGVYRENGIGTKVFFELEGTYWNNNFGKIDNTLVYIFFQYRKKGEEIFSNWINITNSFTIVNGKYVSNTDSFLPNESNGTTALGFVLGKTYELRFIIEDQTYTPITSSIITLSSGIPCTAKVQRDDGTYSIGINKIPDENYALDVNGDIACDNLYLGENREKLSFEAENVTSVFTVESSNASVSGTYASRIFKNGCIVYMNLYITLNTGTTGALSSTVLGKLTKLLPKSTVCASCMIGSSGYGGWTFDLGNGQVNISTDGTISVRKTDTTSTEKKYIAINLTYMV